MNTTKLPDVARFAHSSYSRPLSVSAGIYKNELVLKFNKQIPVFEGSILFSSSQDQYLCADDGTKISGFVIPVLSDADDHGNEYEASLRNSMLKAFPDAGSSYKRLNRVIPRILATLL